jgi:preprotein translocase subunit SecG
MLFSVILSIHVVACVLVILVVLLQSGKGAGFSGIFGGGGSDAVFSAPSGFQFIRKVTTGFAISFFISSLLLTYWGQERGAVRDAPICHPGIRNIAHTTPETAPTVPTASPRLKKRRSPKKVGGFSFVSSVRGWRNWQTRTLEVRKPRGVGVQVPPRARPT